ncbi:hypothetical protein FDP41_013287 [Naegleria fowleri]|uniref:Phosphoglycolate phosphatase n=1 Tax=Naegleria fowleri TaxID=5763 RepID=A0A6A5C2N2_NAEFO|nr:uncharacterized protein FDP41_013287 [Naegleria fowleri]KAF0980804.1 hypothetical protein FDP41_013287 [Naegleria fowleri]
MIELTENNGAVMEQFVSETQCFCLDCDGVIWKGSEVLPHVKETLEGLRKLNKRLFFITNNSSNSRKGYLKKFQSLDLHVDVSEILTSSYAAAVYAKEHAIKKAYVIGGDGIKEELELIGVEACGFEEHLHKTFKEEEFLHEWEEFTKKYPVESIGAVIVGYDNRFNNFKLAMAHQILRRNPQCLFMATNTDATLPYKNNLFFPGGGCFVAALSTAIGRKPDIVAGKPSTLLLDTALHLLYEECKDKVTPENRHVAVCMVGDRLETDIVLGNKTGVKSVCVLTGVATREHLNEIIEEAKQDESKKLLNPQYVLPQLALLRNVVLK